MASPQRAGTHNCVFMNESTTFGTREATFDATAAKLPVWDLSLKLSHKPLENKAIRTNMGIHQPGVGLTATESEVGLTTYASGAGPFVAIPAVENALSLLLSACMGQPPAKEFG